MPLDICLGMLGGAVCFWPQYTRAHARRAHGAQCSLIVPVLRAWKYHGSAACLTMGLSGFQVGVAVLPGYRRVPCTRHWHLPAPLVGPISFLRGTHRVRGRAVERYGFWGFFKNGNICLEVSITQSLDLISFTGGWSGTVPTQLCNSFYVSNKDQTAQACNAGSRDRRVCLRRLQCIVLYE